MELIPILSTIILVATISTFILAVGAYILYKVRERKSHSIPTPTYEQFESEYVEPEIKSVDRKTYVEDLLMKQKRISSQVKNFEKIKSESLDETPVGTAKIKTFKEVKKPGNNGSTKVILPETKFMKYTFDEYVEQVEDDNIGEIKWR